MEEGMLSALKRASMMAMQLLFVGRLHPGGYRPLICASPLSVQVLISSWFRDTIATWTLHLGLWKGPFKTLRLLMQVWLLWNMFIDTMPLFSTSAPRAPPNLSASYVFGMTCSIVWDHGVYNNIIIINAHKKTYIYNSQMSATWHARRYSDTIGPFHSVSWNNPGVYIYIHMNYISCHHAVDSLLPRLPLHPYNWRGML